MAEEPTLPVEQDEEDTDHPRDGVAREIFNLAQCLHEAAWEFDWNDEDIEELGAIAAKLENLVDSLIESMNEVDAQEKGESPSSSS